MGNGIKCGIVSIQVDVCIYCKAQIKMGFKSDSFEKGHLLSLGNVTQNLVFAFIHKLCNMSILFLSIFSIIIKLLRTYVNYPSNFKTCINVI